MGVVNRIFTTVSGLYNNINPITFSGVNDVIVVKRSNGELKCSPFQLRFSKLDFTTTKNQVHIYVNGKLTDIDMTITSQGDLFFAHEIANTEVDYEKFVNYLQSKEVCIISILQNSLECMNKLKDNELLKANKIRKDNLKLRILSQKFLEHKKDNTYDELSKQYGKFYYILNSPENLEYLLNNHKALFHSIEVLLNHEKHHVHGSCAGPILSYSLCMNIKIDASHEMIFNNFLVKEIENPENTVLKLIGCNGQLFYFSFTLFSRLFFELLNSKARSAKIVEFLENEYNKSLGWNFFKLKKPLKRDVSFSIKLSNEELKSLNLNPGKNNVFF